MGKSWHQILLLLFILTLHKPKYHGKIQERLSFFFFCAPFQTSGDYPSLNPRVGLLREENAFQISSSSLRRLPQLLNKYHRQIKQES